MKILLRLRHKINQNASALCLRAKVCVFLLHLKVTLQDQEKVAEYEMKLMDIDSEHLGIPVCAVFTHHSFSRTQSMTPL